MYSLNSLFCQMESFLEQARRIHSNANYDYSEVVYVNCDTSVIIRCPKEGHGRFKKVPYNHINKCSGCPKCLTEQKRAAAAAGKFAKFIENVRQIHGDTYDYTNAVYVDQKTKIQIRCKKEGHPPFMQLPSLHIKGAGCLLCATKVIADKKRLSFEEYVIKAKETHGAETYNYGISVYTGSQEPITIGCRVVGHPPFVISKATLHLQGEGCPKCRHEQQVIKQQKHAYNEFLAKAIALHGSNKYNYDAVQYVDSRTPIKIGCKMHGCIFSQTPLSHLGGRCGCLKCRRDRASFTRDEFITRAKLVHGSESQYDYSEICYINSQSAVTIRCKTHGLFSQIPNSHLQGMGCKQCAIERNAERCRLDTAEFVRRALEIHGSIYDYSQTVYKTMACRVQIRCTRCNKDFQQIPGNHIYKKFGCPHCAGNAILTTEDFVNKAKALHGDAYTYDETVYERSNISVTIRCSKTTWTFSQTPNSHLSGAGCPCCRPKYSKPQMVYLNYLFVENPTLQHALNGGEHRIADSRYSADGYIPGNQEKLPEIVEFHGCLWHGCPRCFCGDNMNPCTKRTFGDELRRTNERRDFIIAKGYTYSEVWECEWSRGIRAVRILQKKWKTLCA